MYPRCSLAYAAPELVRANAEQRNIAADPASDIWALGVVAYEAMSDRGAHRFVSAEQLTESAYGQRDYIWETPEGNTEQFMRSRACHIVLQCLRREPARRPTAAQLLQAIDRVSNATLDAPSGSGGVNGLSKLMRAG